MSPPFQTKLTYKIRVNKLHRWHCRIVNLNVIILKVFNGFTTLLDQDGRRSVKRDSLAPRRQIVGI